MSDDAVRHGWVLRVARILLYVACILGALTAIFAIVLMATSGMAAGLPLLAGAILQVLFWVLAYGVVAVLVHTHAELHRTRRALHTLLAIQNDHFEQQQVQLETIAQNGLLSDAAKSLAHREKERDALRAAIREDITREDWDAAYKLIDMMAEHYGYRDEAERFRQEVDDSRKDAVESKVNSSIEQVEELFASCQWERARAEVRRLLSLYPNHERIAVLPDRLDTSFAERKELLKRQFREAAERKEVNRSIELIKELDIYLTPEEAKELTDMVREVFRDRLDNLTVQFELAVHEQRWMEAVDVANQIMKDYPNTRRAQELRDGVYESLLKRAGMRPGGVEST